MKKKLAPLEALVVFPVYIKLTAAELKGKTVKEVQERIQEVAGEVMEENLIDMKGFVTQCTRKSFEVKVPKIKKTGFRYSAKDALECGTAVSAMDDDTEEEKEDDTNLNKFTKQQMEDYLKRDSFYV